MADKQELHTPRGMHDLLPADEPRRRWLFEVIQKRADGLGYGRIETPAFENPGVFMRSLGETSDVVTKEMFQVRRGGSDAEGESYILRPEGTAGIARAYLEHGMHTWPQPVKLWEYSPMYRAERPQKGRYREFWQAGFEVFGDGHPTADAMLIHTFWQIINDLGLQDGVAVDINSIGDKNCRPKYRKALVDYYTPHKEELCDSCKTRLDKNPLRLLDCKETHCVELRTQAPQWADYWCDECREHFRIVLETLDELGIPYNLEPSLVRGFDYYTRTAFEFRETADERRQSVLAGGGRYDGLIEEFGGQPTPAVGFAIGINRLWELLEEKGIEAPSIGKPDVFVVQLGETAKKSSFSLIGKLTAAGFGVIAQPTKDSLKSQLHLADRAGVRYAVIIGQREVIDNTALLKDMQEETQETVSQNEVLDVLKRKLAK